MSRLRSERGMVFLNMNYYHPNKLWMEFRDSTRESSPLSTPRPVPDPTPCDVHESWLIRKITASIFSDSRMSAFTTNQASGAYAPYGFIRLKCTTCGAEKLVAFSCKKRGFCPSCCAKRMAEAATHLTQNVLHLVPYRQFVVSFPIPLRYWLHTNKRAGVFAPQFTVQKRHHPQARDQKRIPVYKRRSHCRENADVQKPYLVEDAGPRV